MYSNLSKAKTCPFFTSPKYIDRTASLIVYKFCLFSTSTRGLLSIYNYSTSVCVCACSTFSRKLLIRWLRSFARTIDMIRRCELSKMGSESLVTTLKWHLLKHSCVIYHWKHVAKGFSLGSTLLSIFIFAYHLFSHTSIIILLYPHIGRGPVTPGDVWVRNCICLYPQ